MKTNYDDEATRYEGMDDESTRYEESSTPEQSNPNIQSNPSVNLNNEVEVPAANKNGWKRVAMGAGSGLLIGGVATSLMGMKSKDQDLTADGQVNDDHRDGPSELQWVDGRIQVAASVNDEMSFVEAFEAAREEVGPGGCFEWQGNVYGTYTADEWDHMTTDQRAEWSNHFSWSNIDHSSSNVAQHSTTAQHSSTDHSAHTVQTDTAGIADNDIEIVSVNPDNNQNDVVQNSNHVEEPEIQTEEVEVAQVDIPTEEPDIEIIGVVHDSETGANIGGMMVDNQEVILIDVDGDLAFDYMASDLNHNGEVDQNEVIDIQYQNLTVNDLGGFTNPISDMTDSNDAADYATDLYEG